MKQNELSGIDELDAAVREGGRALEQKYGGSAAAIPATVDLLDPKRERKPGETELLRRYMSDGDEDAHRQLLAMHAPPAAGSMDELAAAVTDAHKPQVGDPA